MSRPGSAKAVVPGRVTIAIPVYRRLHYLPGVLRSVAIQEYPDLEILISDNGQNGDQLIELIGRHLDRPYRFRRNAETVPITRHYNQLVDEATGEYFVLLADDDEIGAGFVPRLARLLAEEPQVGVALPYLEMMDEKGETIDWDRGPTPPARISCADFVRIWCTGQYQFVCFCTNMARTEEVRQAGGYPEFPRGTSVDNGLLLLLLLGRSVAFVPDVTFRYRVYEESHGLALRYRELAVDLGAFLRFLDEDPMIRRHATQAPREWKEMRELLRTMAWRTYRYRWLNLYRNRLSRSEWVRAAFAFPFVPAYYAAVLSYLARELLRATKRAVSSRRPGQATS